ncbi:MAG TPA: hypothetical protein VF992_08075 [Thermoplasmata archaeon]
MERRSAALTLVAGLAACVVTVATFLVDLGDHDLAEGFGLLAFVLGLFLVWEGGFSLWRERALAGRQKPR